VGAATFCVGPRGLLYRKDLGSGANVAGVPFGCVTDEVWHRRTDQGLSVFPTFAGPGSLVGFLNFSMSAFLFNMRGRRSGNRRRERGG
jgi:hypothetical protein